MHTVRPWHAELATTLVTIPAVIIGSAWLLINLAIWVGVQLALVVTAPLSAVWRAVAADVRGRC